MQRTLQTLVYGADAQCREKQADSLGHPGQRKIHKYDSRQRCGLTSGRKPHFPPMQAGYIPSRQAGDVCGSLAPPEAELQNAAFYRTEKPGSKMPHYLDTIT